MSEEVSRLSTLRFRLATLRRFRAWARWMTGLGGFGLALFGLCCAAFVVDWTLEMNRPQRAVLLALLVGGGWLAWRRFATPWLRRTESELEVALLVEKQQQIDSDLVAAIQFEQTDAPRWGSPRLEAAVIDYVADFGGTLNIFQGFSWNAVRRRWISLAVGGAAALALSIAYPGHVGAFFNRLFLGSRHYPTKTAIREIVVNGQAYRFEALPAVIRSPFGRPLRLEVQGGGLLPETGYAELRTVKSGVSTRLDLRPAEPAASEGQSFMGSLPRLADSVQFQVYLGDAWTDPVRVEVIPLPVVELQLHPVPPSYAAHAEKDADLQLGSRQLAVIEGSRVDLHLTCVNKPLASATIDVEGTAFPLTLSGEDGKQWTLAANTPFARVTGPIKYQVQVTDADGLQLEQPIEGFIRLRADRGPRIAAGVVAKHVLPNAHPRIRYEARDDFGIAKVRLIRQIMRGDGRMDETTQDIAVIPPAKQPRTTLKNAVYKLDLQSLQLAKGDQIKVTLEAWDYRGQSAGQSSLSEPLVLQVTDVQGILAGMVETDEQSARRLDAIIQRQLGIGETK